jgi:tetratricopeptide (TPR) repeat protein
MLRSLAVYLVGEAFSRFYLHRPHPTHGVGQHGNGLGIHGKFTSSIRAGQVGLATVAGEILGIAIRSAMIVFQGQAIGAPFKNPDPGAVVTDNGGVRLVPPAGTVIDVLTLSEGTWGEAVAIPDLEGELLEGLAFPSAPAFDTWLLTQRRHFRAVAESVLREATLAHLAAGEPETAAALATRLVGLEPFEESYHALLVRSHTAAGDGRAAAQHVAACTELFRRELGTEPGPLLLEALHAVQVPPITRPSATLGLARIELELGEAAVRAGALDRGLECLHRAVAAAQAVGAQRIEAQAMLAIGAALAHACGPQHEDASGALHRVIALDGEAMDGSLEPLARRELAWVDFRAGRYSRAKAWLSEVSSRADLDPGHRALMLFTLGMLLTEVGHYGESMDRLREAVVLARTVGDRKTLGQSFTKLGRAHLLRGEYADAAATLSEAHAILRNGEWVLLRLCPEVYLAELALIHDEPDEATELFQDALALAEELPDSTYLALGQRGLGLVEIARGDTARALERLEAARMQLMRVPDHLWAHAYTLDALCGVAIAHGDPRASGWVSDLASMAARTGMREMLVRAHLHQASLGRPTARESARLLARGIDNPLLHRLVGLDPVSQETASA